VVESHGAGKRPTRQRAIKKEVVIVLHFDAPSFPTLLRKIWQRPWRLPAIWLA
jgi:hypothetical protein